MVDQAKESTYIECLTKQEIIEDIEITFENQCIVDQDPIMPKEEFITYPNSHLNSKDSSTEITEEKCNKNQLIPIKIEPCEEIPQLHSKTMGFTTIEIKVEPIVETSVPVEVIDTLDTPLPKKNTAASFPHLCNICDCKLKYKSLLVLHMRSHTGEKPFSCNLCQRQFTQKSHLTFHMKTHTGQKHYCCDLCQKKFSNNSNLTDHRRTHTGEKPYSCTVCQVKYAQKNHLTAHMKTHNGERPYSCDICLVKFTHKHHLTDHRRIHTGEKPYSCNLCEAKFTRKYILNNHIRTHSAIYPS